MRVYRLLSDRIRVTFLSKVVAFVQLCIKREITFPLTAPKISQAST